MTDITLTTTNIDKFIAIPFDSKNLSESVLNADPTLASLQSSISEIKSNMVTIISTVNALSSSLTTLTTTVNGLVPTP